MSAETAIRPSVVIDCGSLMTKAGFGGEIEPLSMFPTAPGKSSKSSGASPKETFFGLGPSKRIDGCKMSRPIDRGEIVDWEAIENVWRRCYREVVNVRPENHPLLLTDAVHSPHRSREKMAEIAFESLQVPLFFVETQPRLSLWASGRVTGLVIEIGDGITQFAPVFENGIGVSVTSRHEMAGCDMTNFLVKSLEKCGVESSFLTHIDTVRDIKEKFCFVMPSYAPHLGDAVAKEYVLPDGKKVSVGLGRFSAPEILFTPSLFFESDVEGGSVSADMKSLDRLACTWIVNADKRFSESVVLSGGSAMLPGLKQRLSSGLTSLLPKECRVEVSTIPEARYQAWLGGSIIVCVSTFESQRISKKEYAEEGMAAVRKRCCPAE